MREYAGGMFHALKLKLWLRHNPASSVFYYAIGP